MDISPNSEYTPIFEGEGLSTTQRRDAQPHFYPSCAETLDPAHDRPTTSSDGHFLSEEAVVAINPSGEVQKKGHDTVTISPDVQKGGSGTVASKEGESKLSSKALEHYNYSRLKAFVIPDEFVLDDIPDQRQGRSIVYDTGVIVRGVGEHEGVRRWYCLLDDCLSTISIRKNKSNITDHLRKKHKIESKRTKQIFQARANFGTKLTKERLRFLKMHPCRYHHINMVKIAIRLVLPFGVAEVSEFRTAIQMLDHRNEYDKPLHSKAVKKIILELYLAASDSIKNVLKFRSANSSLPFLHLRAFPFNVIFDHAITQSRR